MTTRTLRAVAGAASLLFFVAACGDDDGDFDAEGFCAAADVLGNTQDPTAEQIDAYRALDTPEVGEATEALQAAELEHCGVVAGEE